MSRWPRGRFNGQRIVGIEVRVRLDVTDWRWCLPDRYGRCLAIGPLKIWAQAAYEPDVLVRVDMSQWRRDMKRALAMVRPRR